MDSFFGKFLPFDYLFIYFIFLFIHLSFFFYSPRYEVLLFKGRATQYYLGHLSYIQGKNRNTCSSFLCNDSVSYACLIRGDGKRYITKINSQMNTQPVGVYTTITSPNFTLGDKNEKRQALLANRKKKRGK